MKKKLLAVMVAGLMPVAPLAWSQGLTWSGSASLGYRHTNDKARDPSKLNEYRDLDSRVIGDLELNARGENYYFNGFIENPGADDLFIDLKGGKYGSFKYQLYNNELRHNFGSGPGALSPYSGIGGSVLTATFPNSNPATWNSFDHSYSRRDTGGMFELTLNSPWYVRFEGNEVVRKGINVIAGAQGTSPGNGFIDLPSPIDYKTRNGSAEAGFQGKTSHFAVNLMYSRFENDNPLLSWSNGFLSPANPFNYDTTVRPPDNEMWRIGFNGNVRKLPGDSTLAGRLTYSKLTNSVAMQTTMLSTGSTNPATAASSPVFNGEIVYKTVGLSLSSHPVHNLDTRAYWNYAKEQNGSTRITFSPTATTLLGGASSNCSNAGSTTGLAPFGLVPCTPEVFGYKKNNLGIEAGYRVNRENKLSGGYDYYNIERERFDFTKNVDHKIFAEWKNSSIEDLTGRIKYQYLSRRSDWSVPGPVIAFNPTEAYVRRFDVANVNQNSVKVVLDYSPIPYLDFGFEAIYKKNEFKDTPLGRTDDQRQEYYASVSLGDPNKLRVFAFADIEFLEYNSRHRVGGTTLANSDPNAPPSGGPPSTIYTWTAKNQDKAWQVGLGTDWLPSERLSVKSSLIYAETNGRAEFAAQPGTVLNPNFFYPIGNFDNTRRLSLNVKGNYKLDKNWSLTGGYAFERYRYSDIGYDGTRYVVPPLGAGASYTTGQYAFQPYTANIFYMMANYKF